MFPSFYPVSRIGGESAGVSQPVDCVTLHMPKPSPHPTFYNYHRPSWLFIHICVVILWSMVNLVILLVPLVILWCGALGQLGRQFLDNLYSRHTNGYPPRIAGFVKCISGQCPAPEYLPGSHGQGDKTPQYPAKPCPGWQYTGKDKIQTEREGKTRSSLHFCYICRITLHMPSNAYCQFVKQKVKT